MSRESGPGGVVRVCACSFERVRVCVCVVGRPRRPDPPQTKKDGRKTERTGAKPDRPAARPANPLSLLTSTLPLAIVRTGSTTTASHGSWYV